jgi:hypothetical protein
MNLDLNMQSLWDKIGKTFVRGLMLRVRRQAGIDGARYSRPAQSTLESRGVTTRPNLVGGKVKRAKASSLDRLYVTGRFSKGAFASIAGADKVTVYCPDRPYDANVTYADIVRYNSAGQPDVNPNIKRPPLVFPVTPQEVMLMREEFTQAGKLISSGLRGRVRKSDVIKNRTFKIG